MRRLLMLATGLLLVAGVPAATPSKAAAGTAPESIPGAEEAAARLDAHYYYPQTQGLRDLRARVRVAALDSLFAANRLPVPSIEFLWEAPGTRRFVVGPSASAELRAGVARMLEGRGEMIVPEPLSETLERYETKTTRAAGDTLILEASTSDSLADLKTLRAFIETGQWRMSRMEAETARGVLVTENSFQQVRDLNLLSRMEVRFNDLSIHVGIEHVAVGDLWLVSRIHYRVRGGTAGSRGNEFDIALDDYHVNEGIPDSLLGR
jgi:hypothetical protein